MSADCGQETLVGGQFGPQAKAYLNSTVHAAGADLEALAALAAARPGARALDLGCGGGHVTFAVAPHAAEVTACDLSPDMLAVVAQTSAQRGFGNVVTQQGSAMRLPFADAAFDLVLSRYSAHHWPDFELGLREAARVLKPGGTAGFVDVVAPGLPVLDTYFQAIELLRDCSHVRDYAPAEWEAGLARAGLVRAEARRFRVRLEFGAWVERMRTPPERVAAIRSLQAAVAPETAAYFATEADGSFEIEVGFFRAEKA